MYLILCFSLNFNARDQGIRLEMYVAWSQMFFAFDICFLVVSYPEAFVHVVYTQTLFLCYMDIQFRKWMFDETACKFST